MPTQSASKEDILGPRMRLYRPEDVRDYLCQYITERRLEWFAALLLDPREFLVTREPLMLYVGQDCPVLPYVDLPAFFRGAKRIGAHTVVTARYHPHAPRIFTKADYAQFDAFCLKAEAYGVPRRNHLTMHATGDLLSWRDWGQPPEQGGTRVRKATALAYWYSAISTAVIMSLVGSG